MQEQKSKDLALFFGPIGSATLIPVQGNFTSSQSFSITFGEQSEEIRKKVCSQISNFDDILVPVPPAVPLKTEKIEDQKAKLPVLSTPMIKVQKEKAVDGIAAIRSGRRSAIVPIGGKIYRLKGCGNDDQGFILQKADIPFIQESPVQVRGSNFQHTAIRELYYSARVSQVLKSLRIPNANIPIGMWHYDQEFEKKEASLKNQGNLSKYCAIFQTKGERRLATHLLQGFGLLLDRVAKNIPEEDRSDLIQGLVSCFPDHRKAANGAEVQNPLQKPKQKLVSSTQSQLKFVDPQAFEAKLTRLQWYQSGPIYTQEMNANLVDVLEFVSLLTQIDDMVPSELAISSAVILFERIGLQVGTIVRTLQEADISWGFFFDHHPFLPHCNAHPNNVIVLPPPYEANTILAPLDQDLSYSWPEFVNIMKQDEFHGQQDRLLFDSWLNSERHAMEQGLSGAQNMSNFQYNTVAQSDESIDESEKKKLTDLAGLLELGLRQLMIRSFRAAFDKKKSTLSKVIDAKESEILEKWVRRSLEAVILEVAS